MALYSKSTGDKLEARPKKTRQGDGKHTKYTATSRNVARKKYRGQGKWLKRTSIRRSFFMLIINSKSFNGKEHGKENVKRNCKR